MNIQERLSQLSPAKRAMFEKRARGEALTPLQVQTIPQRDHETYLLSIEQEQIWFINQLDPNSYFLHISSAYSLVGQLDVEALESAVNEMIVRHENLRTIFTEVDAQPVAVVLPSLKIHLTHMDIPGEPGAERDAKMHQAITGEIYRPFDLSKTPLIRPVLLRFSEEEHALLVIIHHIATDRLSIDIFWKELITLYDAFSKGEPSPLPKLWIQYGDFALWQREKFQTETMAEHLAYWKEKLTNAPTLTLATDYPRQPVPIYPGARERWAIPDDLWQDFMALGIAENTTRFTIFLTLFSVLLYRYTGEEDILIGSPVNNRDREEVQGLIGYFLNTLGLRVDLSGDPTFRELLARTRKMVVEAIAHQDLSISRVLPELRVRREGNAPLYQVGFVYTNNNVVDPFAKKLSLDISELKIFYDSTPMVDLAFGAFDAVVGGSIGIDYNTSLFTQDTIKRMIRHFHVLLENILADPDRPISNLPLLDEAERAQLLLHWNQTQRDYPQHKCLHEDFEAHAAAAPDAIALIFEDEQVSYGQLDARANQLAHHLRTLGVGAETLVGICVERSPDMLCGLLAILKAGGAYLPLDPTYPAERLAFMLADSKVKIVLTQTRLLDLLRGYEGRVVCLDERLEESTSKPVTNTTPENLAYVIYTSGSTGRPKGVMVTHGNVVNFFTAMDEPCGSESPGTWLALTSLSFDISVLELFWTLARGYRVVLQREEYKPAPGTSVDAAASDTTSGEQGNEKTASGRNSYSLAAQIRNHGVTHMQCTPSMARLIATDEESLHAVASLRKFLLGGEALSVSLAEQFHRDAAGELYNMYGPTETTIWSAFHRVDQLDGSIPLGRPIANTTLYILDSRWQPLPVGVPGELYIGGVGVTRGYLFRPELTAERFIPDPYGREAGGRLYRTGDRARYLPDGNIEFLGRIDHQVKLRGYRIELGEIEAVIGQHPDVQEAVVVTREDLPGDKRLVAYFVTNNQPPPSVNQLRNFLKERLPEYMIPAAFVLLDTLPLTPGGKINRQALPSPGTASSEPLEHRPPRNETEALIVGIWEDVLKLSPVSVHDNFFDLGGHSLLAIQVQRKINAALSRKISVAELFQHPTVSALARHLSQQEDEEPSLQKSYARAELRRARLSGRRTSNQTKPAN